MKRTITTILLICALPRVVSAHGFARYVSTPITPPYDFRWWFPIAITILITGSFLIIWRILRRHWLTAIGLSLCSVILFSILFFGFGLYASNKTTAPPPGLGFPHPTFWGMGWGMAGWLFVEWNFYGYCFLLFSLFLCGGIFRAKAQLKKLAVWISIPYILGLIPYFATGAFVHGWAGGYVRMGCDRRLEFLNFALVVYAEEHDGRFPSADRMESVLNALEPYLSQDRIRYPVPVDVCPLGEAFERHPKRYEWDKSFSGISIQNVDPNQLFKENLPIYCPYHEQTGSIVTFNLTNQILSAIYSMDNKTDAGDKP